MNVLVIDTTRRALATFVASATKTNGELGNDRLVLRHAADGPSLADLGDLADTTMPILLIGEGYKAQSSEGFVTVNGGGPEQSVIIVGAAGCLGAKSLRPLGKALWATLLPPSSIKKAVSRGSYSNAQVRDASIAAASLFGKATKATTIVEGQSDWAVSYTLKPVEGWAWPKFLPEHQERFGDEALFEAALNDRARYLARPSQDDEPETEEAKAEARKAERHRRMAIKLGICVVHKAWLDAFQSADHETYQRLESGRPILTLRGAPHGAVANLRQQLADKRAELEELGWKAELRGYDLVVVNAEKGLALEVGYIYEDAIKERLGVTVITENETTDEA